MATCLWHSQGRGDLSPKPLHCNLSGNALSQTNTISTWRPTDGGWELLRWWQMRRRMTDRQLWTCSSLRGCDVKARGPGDVRKWWCRIIGKSCSKWKSRSRNITLRTDEAWMGFPLGLPAEFQEASYSEISSEVSSEVYPAPKKMTPNSGQLPCRIKWSMKDSEIILSKLFQLQVKKSNISKRTY